MSQIRYQRPSIG